jgi:hypothetical protein
MSIALTEEDLDVSKKKGVFCMSAMLDGRDLFGMQQKKKAPPSGVGVQTYIILAMLEVDIGKIVV